MSRLCLRRLDLRPACALRGRHERDPDQINVNDNCRPGSTALFLAPQAWFAAADRVLALGLEQVNPATRCGLHRPAQRHRRLLMPLLQAADAARRAAGAGATSVAPAFSHMKKMGRRSTLFAKVRAKASWYCRKQSACVVPEGGQRRRRHERSGDRGATTRLMACWLTCAARRPRWSSNSLSGTACARTSESRPEERRRRDPRPSTAARGRTAGSTWARACCPRRSTRPPASVEMNLDVVELYYRFRPERADQLRSAGTMPQGGG